MTDTKRQVLAVNVGPVRDEEHPDGEVFGAGTIPPDWALAVLKGRSDIWQDEDGNVPDHVPVAGPSQSFLNIEAMETEGTPARKSRSEK